MGLKAYLITYVIGGITFIPLLIITTIYIWLKWTEPPIGDGDPSKRLKANLEARAEKQKQRQRASSSAAIISGWLTVRRHFKPSSHGGGLWGGGGGGGAGSPAPSSVDLTGTAGSDKEKDTEKTSSEPSEKDDSSSITTTTQSTTTSSSSFAKPTMAQRMMQGYQRVVEARQARSGPAPKEYYWCVLKGSVLFMYEDDAQTECVAAISLDKYRVDMETPHGKFEGRDGEMFAKRNGICLSLYNPGETVGHADDGERTGLPVLARGMTAEGRGAGDKEEGGAGGGGVDKEKEGEPWYLFCRNNSKTEDWYIALATVSALKPTTNLVFNQSNMQALVNTIDTEPDPTCMRVVNALLGRIWMGISQTDHIEKSIVARIMKKLSKFTRPTMLGEIKITEVHIGSTPPFLSRPSLKEALPTGKVTDAFHVNYRPDTSDPSAHFRITVETSAHLPVGFKTFDVQLVLQVVVKRLEGDLIVQIKPPPSNRIWYGFTEMPKLEVDILPVVSDRSLKWGMVLNQMDKALRQAIAEAIVLPNMDDIAFFSTAGLDMRGGIWDAAARALMTEALKPASGNGDTDSHAPVDLVPSAEDPTSATAETTSMRHRRSNKSQTIQVNGQSGPHEPMDFGLPRTDTAPAAIAGERAAASVSSTTAKKGWFAGSGSRPSSVASSIHGEPIAQSRSRSSERKATPTPRPPAASEPNLPGQSDGQADTMPAPPSLRTIADGRRTSVDSQAPASLDRTVTDATTSSGTSTSTAAIISSLRARDREAVKAQLSTAKDSVKAWQKGWIAKRRGGGGGGPTVGLKGEGVSEEGDAARSRALYRPPAEDNELGTSPTRSLKERLESATRAEAAAASSAPVAVPGGQSHGRQGSLSGSRPALSTSPGQHDGSAWTLASAKPTTAQVVDTAPRRFSHGSASSMVNMQPGKMGRGMVVPRVPKKPGEVLAMGSTNGELVRKLSEGGGGGGAGGAGDGEVEVSKGSTSRRGSGESGYKEERGAREDLPSLPARAEEAVDVERNEGAAVPPSLPVRKTPDTSTSDLRLAEKADHIEPSRQGLEVEEALPDPDVERIQASRGEPILRTESAPAGGYPLDSENSTHPQVRGSDADDKNISTLAMTRPLPSSPAVDVVTETTGFAIPQNAPSAVDLSPAAQAEATPTASEAEDALRRLKVKNDVRQNSAPAPGAMLGSTPADDGVTAEAEKTGDVVAKDQ